MDDLYAQPPWLDQLRRLTSMPEGDDDRGAHRTSEGTPPRVELRLSNSSEIRRPKR